MLLWAVLASHFAACESPPDTPRNAAGLPFVTWLDRQIPNLLARYDVPGAAVAVMEHGEISLLQGYGFADTTDQVPMTEYHLFNAASISKAVTAWGVMRLVEQRRIDLDQPVNTYLEWWKLADGDGAADGVTVRRLLSHTAGISMPATPGFRWPMAVPELVDILSGNYEDSTYAKSGTRVEILYPPGREFHYSGGGYLVLQLLIEEVTEQPFQAYMQETVLSMLGMTDSRFGWDPSLRRRMATPYLAGGHSEDIFRLPGHAASSLHASARDLAQFMLASAVQNGELRNLVISDAAFELMLEPVVETRLDGAELGQMGLGYFLQKTDAALFAGHSGGNAGWRARLLVAPEDGEGILVLTNSDSGEDLVEKLSCLWLESRQLPPIFRACRS